MTAIGILILTCVAVGLVYWPAVALRSGWQASGLRDFPFYIMLLIAFFFPLMHAGMDWMRDKLSVPTILEKIEIWGTVAVVGSLIWLTGRGSNKLFGGRGSDDRDLAD